MRIRIRPTLKLSVDSIVRFVLCLYFVISIFEPYLNGIIGTVTKYYMFFVMFVLLWRNRFRIRIRKISLAYVAWLLLKLVSLLWSEDFATPKLHMISQLGMVLYLVILIGQDSDEKTMDAIETTYWLASLAIGVLSIFFSDAYRGRVEVRQVLVIMGTEVDPNNQAALLLVGIALSLNNLLYEKRRTALSIIGLVINCYACFYTASRAAIVTMGAVILFCVIYNPDRKKLIVIIRNIALLCAITVALCIAVYRYLPEANIIRLFDFAGYEGGTGRTVLWSRAWDVFSRDMLTVLFGAGWGTATLYNNGTGVHNTFLTLLCDVGLVGTILFMSPIIVIALRLLKRREPISVLLLGAQFVPAFFIDAINKRFFWNAILILLLCYYRRKNKSSTMQGVNQ